MPTEAPDHLVTAALSYAADGYLVLPLVPEGKAPDGSLVPHGLRDASCDLVTVNDWWTYSPAANIGVVAPDRALVLDVDKPTDYAVVDRLSRDHGLDLDTAVTVTGSGGWHLWFLLPEGAPMALRGDLDGVVTRLPGRAYLVMPGSVVRQPDGSLGRYSELNPGAAPVELPPDVVGMLAEPRAAARVSAEPVIIRRPFPERLRLMIESGEHDYPSRSHALVATVVPWRDAGGDRASWLAAVTDPAHGISARYLEKVEADGEYRALSDLERMWDYYAQSDSLPGGRPSKLTILSAIESQGWNARVAIALAGKPQTRPSLLAVWVGYAQLAVAHETLSPFVTSRDLALASGIASNQSVLKKLRVFRDAGILSESTVEVEGHSPVQGFKLLPYSLSHPLSTQYGKTLNVPPMPVGSLPSHPVWRGMGLGPGPWTTHSALVWADGPLAAEDVASITGQSTLTADRHLERMSKHGLACRQDSGLWMVGEDDPSCVQWVPAEESRRNQETRYRLAREGYRPSTYADLVRAA